MKKTAIIFLFLAVLLGCTAHAAAQSGWIDNRETVEAFELNFSIPQGYFSGKPFSYTQTAAQGITGGRGSYYYKLDDGSVALFTVNVRRRDDFDRQTGLSPVGDDRRYLEQVAELMMDGTPVSRYDTEFVETDVCWLLRVRSISDIGSSFDMFVIYTPNRLYNGVISIDKPGYEDECAAFMDAVLSEIVPEPEQEEPVYLPYAGLVDWREITAPAGYYNEERMETDGIRSYLYSYDAGTLGIIWTTWEELENQSGIIFDGDIAVLARQAIALSYNEYAAAQCEYRYMQAGDALQARITGEFDAGYSYCIDYLIEANADGMWMIGFQSMSSGEMAICTDYLNRTLASGRYASDAGQEVPGEEPQTEDEADPVCFSDLIGVWQMEKAVQSGQDMTEMLHSMGRITIVVAENGVTFRLESYVDGINGYEQVIELPDDMDIHEPLDASYPIYMQDGMLVMEDGAGSIFHFSLASAQEEKGTCQEHQYGYDGYCINCGAEMPDAAGDRYELYVDNMYYFPALDMLLLKEGLCASFFVYDHETRQVLPARAVEDMEIRLLEESDYVFLDEHDMYWVEKMYSGQYHVILTYKGEEIDRISVRCSGYDEESGTTGIMRLDELIFHNWNEKGMRIGPSLMAFDFEAKFNNDRPYEYPDGYYRVKMEVYNTAPVLYSANVYDARNKACDSVFIKPYWSEFSAWNVLEYTWNGFWDFWDFKAGNTETYTAKTDIDIIVPAGGYISFSDPLETDEMIVVNYVNAALSMLSVGESWESLINVTEIGDKAALVKALDDMEWEDAVLEIARNYMEAAGSDINKNIIQRMVEYGSEIVAEDEMLADAIARLIVKTAAETVVNETADYALIATSLAAYYSMHVIDAIGQLQQQDIQQEILLDNARGETMIYIEYFFMPYYE